MVQTIEKYTLFTFLPSVVNGIRDLNKVINHFSLKSPDLWLKNRFISLQMFTNRVNNHQEHLLKTTKF